MDGILNYTIEEIKNEYTTQDDVYICNRCGRSYTDNEVYPLNGRYYRARKMIEYHISQQHGPVLESLINSNSKYNTLTKVQSNILRWMHEGKSDKEISELAGIALSTVRRQRFNFREKAKQAKYYLAIYELAFEGENRKEEEGIMNMHDTATMLDDRYIITEKEAETVITNMFSSLEPLRLKTFPAKEKKKLVVLKRICLEFEKDRHYTEKEVNDILKSIHPDFPTIRRYLFEYGFLDRTINGSEYWMK